MYTNIIKKYVDALKKSDIVEFARKQNVKLSNIELDTIYEVIKTRWEEIYTSGLKVIEEYKNKLSSATYKVVVDLYKDTEKKFLKK